MNACILVVDDDPEIVGAIAITLEREGYRVLRAYDGMEALDLALDPAVRLILIDVMMPKLDGLSALLRIREKRNLPVIVLSAKSEDTDKILGLSMGADDYVTKPFSMPVLLEKIRVILRRSGEAAESRLHYRDLVVDLDTREAALDGRPLDLTAREFELLRTFLAAPGRVFTREMLLSRLWGYDFFGDERVVDSHIKNLRHKLGRDYIETVRGVGYRAAKETR